MKDTKEVLRQQLADLKAQREKAAKELDPLREERARLSKEIAPLEAKLRQIDLKMKAEVERTQIFQLDQEIAVLLRALGSRSLAAESGSAPR